MRFSDFQIIQRHLLGLNSRNLDFLRPNNLSQAVQIADNKLLTKEILKKAELPAPKTFAVIANKRELKKFDPGLLPDSFVLKPNRGFGGEGILIAYNRKKNGSWLNSDQNELTWLDVKVHVQDILDGRFSLADIPDIAFFEERIKRDSFFKIIAYRGLPDIRVIVYNKIPIMAMLRLPTQQSHGKANLHLGGIGVGLDIGTGQTTYAICRDEIIYGLPLSFNQNKIVLGKRFANFKIPNWPEILELAIKSQIASGLGYLGVDIVLAKDRGPMVLEINARPGLSIQIANLAGLKERLLRVKGLAVADIEKGIRVAKELFSKPMREAKNNEKEAEKKIISASEPVWLYPVADNQSLSHQDYANTISQPQDELAVQTIAFKEERIRVEARIDTGAKSTAIDYELARQLGYGQVIEFINKYDINKTMESVKVKRLKNNLVTKLKEHPAIVDVVAIHSASGSTVRVMVNLKFSLRGKVVSTKVSLIDREHLNYDMIVGRQDLAGFLIDPAIASEKEIITKKEIGN